MFSKLDGLTRFLAPRYRHPGSRGSLSQALEWMAQGAALFDDFPHPSTGPGPDHLARLARQLGIQALEACWQQVTGDSPPGAVRDYVRSYRPDTGTIPKGQHDERLSRYRGASSGAAARG